MESQLAEISLARRYIRRRLLLLILASRCAYVLAACPELDQLGLARSTVVPKQIYFNHALGLRTIKVGLLEASLPAGFRRKTKSHFQFKSLEGAGGRCHLLHPDCINSHIERITGSRYRRFISIGVVPFLPNAQRKIEALAFVGSA